jgi:hypothetical protein
MNWKGLGKKNSSDLIEALSGNLPEGTEENHEETQTSQCPG